MTVSLVREYAMLYHAGPSSLVFFAGCQIITDSDLQIQSNKNEVQLKMKLHQLWRMHCDYVDSSLVFF